MSSQPLLLRCFTAITAFDTTCKEMVAKLENKNEAELSLQLNMQLSASSKYCQIYKLSIKYFKGKEGIVT